VYCERFEVEQTVAGEHERYHALADELVLRHAATSHPAAGPMHPHRHGCCG